jgi:L-lysine exporter family protein LysE/ArgO
MIGAFLHGFLLALALILPLGPQNTFVLSQGATTPRWRFTWPVVVTAALCDSFLIGVAVAGVSLVLLAIPDLKLGLSLAGVAFLLNVGYRTFRAPVALDRVETGTGTWGLGQRVRYSLSVSLLNPHAIMDTVVVIGGGAALYNHPAEKWAYALAAMLVSWLWFTALSLVGRGLHRVAATPTAARWINRGSGTIMWAVAARTLWQLAHRPA